MVKHIRIILIFMISLSIQLACNQSQDHAQEQETSPTNFILLMGDDHGWDEVGYNGHPFVKTPVLDEMASQGMRFDRFYAGHPTCSPTRASFLTGRHPNRCGTFTPNWSMRPEEISIAHLAKEAGYRSAHFGKWHVGPVKKESPTSPGAMGFDAWLSHDNFFELDPVLSRNGEAPKKIEGESSKILIDETIRFIEQSQENEKPFLIVVWFGSPHEPYSALPDDLALYQNLPDSLSQDTVRLTSNETGKATNRPLRDVLQERYAEITAMDRAIGELRDHLRRNDLKENTFLLYCGDNGTPASAGRTAMTIREEKASLYEGGILVPGIVEWPAVINTPMVNKNIAVTSDILPTFTEITGQSVPDRPLDGVSLFPFIQDPSNERTAPIFFWQFDAGNAFSETPEHYIDPTLQEGTTPLVKMMAGKYTRSFRNYVYPEVSADHFGGERAMMTNRFKLVLDGQTPNTAGDELYDLEKDRAEKINVADEYPQVVDEMKNAMKSWQESVLNSLTGADY